MHPARDPIHARTASPHLQVLLWLCVWTTTLTVDLINPLRALMVWAWVELLNTACFTTGTSMLNRDLCLVDIAIYNAHLRVRARLLARPRLPCCLRTRLAALGGSALPGAEARPLAASPPPQARASRLDSCPSPHMWSVQVERVH